jgi:hypothetical protein
LKQHNNRFKEALDHKKWCKIEQPRVSTYQNSKCEISPEDANARLSSFFPLKAT